MVEPDTLRDARDCADRSTDLPAPSHTPATSRRPLSPSPLVRRQDSGGSPVSRSRSFQTSSGFKDSAGLLGGWLSRPASSSFPPPLKCRRPDFLFFDAQSPSPPVPLFTLRRLPRGSQRKTRGRVVRYSFLVRLFHSLLHAGLSRRSEIPKGSVLDHAATREFPLRSP